MVLKTAEGISGIAEESRGLTNLYPRNGSCCQVGKREQTNLAVVLSHTVYLERWHVLR